MKFEILMVISLFLCEIEGSEKSPRYTAFWLDPDEKIWLEWSLSANQTITFEIETYTKGWIGLGFGRRSHGGMKGADLLMTGVYANGTPYAYDLHSEVNGVPFHDKSQDWELLEAEEIPEFEYKFWKSDEEEPVFRFKHRPFKVFNETMDKCLLCDLLMRMYGWRRWGSSIFANMTRIKVRRKLDTCDPQDLPIDGIMTHLIWAIGQSDDLSYHGEDRKHRGALTLNLFESQPEYLEEANRHSCSRGIRNQLPDYATPLMILVFEWMLGRYWKYDITLCHFVKCFV